MEDTRCRKDRLPALNSDSTSALRRVLIAFRKGAYLEFSVATTLPAATSGSRYKMAALAFDDHFSHLARPMMAYFNGDLPSMASPRHNDSQG